MLRRDDEKRDGGQEEQKFLMIKFQGKAFHTFTVLPYSMY